MAPSGRTSFHAIYCKKHALRKNSSKTPNDRTLFTIGWPPYCTENDIEQFFYTQMELTVENVYLRKSPGNIEEMNEEGANSERHDFGYIVFKTIDDLKNVLTACGTRNVFICVIKTTGLSLWAKQYKAERPSINVLSARAQKQIEKYDTKTEEERKRRKILSEPDEEGWVTVAKKPNIEPERLAKPLLIKCIMNLYSFS